ncbi:Ankyrin repeats (3 copies) [Phytophthora infestans]|uniref:Ankyrin repeats (3 copies) n=1 Tax=Phytophthora infestans TaxID=4787 RepID=A0A833SQL6_PHYIN|nr:Ankyrin repeats (3 copies) [Phytophthora infestans]
MGIRNTRPLPLASEELMLAPFFKRRFRSWHLEHVRLALQRYRLLTPRFCVDALQLSTILGIKEKKLVDDVMRLFLPRTPTRVQCMVDVMEILIALVLVCQAPSMLQRFELIFDIVDLEARGAISTTDLIMLCGAVGRAIMKLFEYTVKPEQQAAMAYTTDVLDSLGGSRNDSISKEMLCKFMVSDRFAVHYTKQCTGEDKPKLYIMLEKNSEFLGAVEFSSEQHMQATSLRTVRDMLYTQVHRVPEDFSFLCQGRELNKVWEVDRRAWSVVPFALRGSPGLRADILARNRGLQRPKAVNAFEFRYMGNLITRYKKSIHDIKPVYKHHAFRLRGKAPRKHLEAAVEWRVATTWSGEWMYEQQRVRSTTRPGILKALRASARPQQGVLVVKSHFGEILSSSSMADTANGDKEWDQRHSTQLEGTPSTPPQPERRMQRIVSLSLRERKREDKLRKQRMQWKARLIAMEAQHQTEKKSNNANGKRFRQSMARNTKFALDNIDTSSVTTVLVHIEEDNILPSRLVRCEPKKRRRPKKSEWKTWRWGVPGRLLSSLPPRRKMMKASKISDDICLAPPPGTSTNQELGLGKFLSSTNIFLEDDEVEVFPVLIIRPLGEQVCVNEYLHGDLEYMSVPFNVSVDQPSVEKVLEKPLFANKAYLTEFEYEISARESNYEALYQHVGSGLLQDAIWLNRRDACGRTMLHDAAEFGHANVMELLLKARVLVDVKDSGGDTPLHHAARNGRLKEVVILLRERATPWLPNAEGKSPLYCACETAAKILNAQPDGRGPEATHADGPRNDLASQPYPQLRQVIDLLWNNYKVEDLVRKDGYDRTNCVELEKEVYGDMIQACHDGNLLRVQKLVELDKRSVLQFINEQMEILQRTALHEAAEQGHTATVNLLVKLGADGFLTDQRLQVPLHLAAWKGFDKIAKCLVTKFPQTAAYQDIAGCTPLHLAVQQKHWGIAADLICAIQARGDVMYHDTGAWVNPQGRSVHCLNLHDIHGYTALHYACIHGNFKICKALVSAGATTTTLRCEYRVPAGSPHLLGRWWKGNVKRVGKRKSLMKEADQIKVFDVEAAELVVQGCKQNFSNYQERLAMLELLFNLENVDDSSREKPTPVRMATSPVFHIAAQLADINISIAVEMCRQLHKLQVEINMPHPRTGETVLLQECKRICRVAKNCSGMSSQYADGAMDQLALVRCLLELGANVDLANEVNGESPLGCAAWYGHLALLDLLLEAGADKDKFLRQCSFRPLHFAALGNNVACAKMLISSSATVNVEMPPTNAETPLYFAIRSKSAEMVDLLLRSNADPCSPCTVQQGCSSFGVIFSLPDGCISRAEEGASTEHQGVGTARIVASPLTFGLLVSQSLKECRLPKELSCTVERSRRQTQWEGMKSICTMIAKRLLEANGGSKGIVTRGDILLACAMGFWELVQLLLTQQISLSNAPSVFGMNALHLAAAAGQTKVVTALVAGGMNVNCITRSDSSKPQRSEGRRSWYEWSGCGHRGALFYALIHGHAETAAKLLVLGAKAEQTVPHLQKRKGAAYYIDNDCRELFVVHFIVSKAMVTATTTGYVERGTGSVSKVEEASVKLVHLIETSINERVPLLHLAVALGYAPLVRVLVEAGMTILSGSDVDLISKPGMSSTNMPTETIIHIAISYGHLTMVEYFAKLAQNSFPGSLHREGKVFKSLLVTACEAHQIQILRFLLKHDGVDGGGFTYSECRDEFQSALCTCATFQFVEGFEVLIQCGARPDVNTLVGLLKGLAISSKNERASCQIDKIHEVLEWDDCEHRSSFSFPGKRRPHDFRSNSVGIATKLLELVLSSNFMDDIDEFLGPSPVYELMFKILVICSRNGLWFVLDELFILHQDSFVDATSIWKPVLVRAAISCLVLHRAAMDNQVNLVAFFLRLGAPADLRLGKTRPTKCPIWYAGSRGSLEAFLCLALHSETFARDLELDALRKFDFTFLPLVFRSIDESRGTLSTSNTTCRWQNLSAFSCIELPKRHTNGLLIQKFVNYGLLISRGHSDTSLLHHASRRGELIAVQALVKAGADLTETNQNGVTPLEIASGRKDGFGLSIVRHLIAAIAQQKLSSAATIIDRALIRCFAQESPYALRIAQALLNAGASPRFSCNATGKEANVCGFARISAMFFAMKTANSAGVRLLVDHGAAITVGLSEVFLAQFVIAAQHPVKRHWRRFSKYLKQSNGRKLLLDIETIMKTLLEKEVFPTAVNADLVLQMLTSASAMAATIAHAVDDSKRFWGIADTILDKFPKEASSRTAEWNQKAALHYAVASLELPIVAKLAKLRGFDLLAQDENKQTSLHLAAVGGDETICRVLLEKLHSNTVKATAIDAQDSRGRTALHLAVIHGHETIASMIVAAGASLDVRCREGLTALLYAAKCNRLAILIALFSRAQPKPHNALLTVHQEAGIFVAARSGAFSVVRWFLNLYENESKTDAHNTTVLNGRRTMFNMQCSDERTVLHYAAIYGNEETLQQLKVTEDGVKSGLVDVVNARDKFGYTSLMYAIAFGRLRVVRSLCELGADPFTSIDHSGDPGAHPYTTGFDIAGLLQWFALPGWYSFACKYLSPQEKMSLVRSTSIYDDYLRHSSYTKRKKRDKPPVEWRSKWERPLGWGKSRGSTQIRTSMRSWRFPYKSIFDYACEIGNAQIVDFLVSLRLPQTFRGLTYQAQRRNFMQAVRWNRLEIVKTLITSAAGSIVIESTTGNHFMNFLETGIECAVSRGLEDMAIYLVDKWQGIMENGRDGATPSAFAFQFAPAFQVACIRRMSRLMERMIERGGEEIIEFHLNEGPALVYAFAFGYVEIADLLLRNGADPAMATATYSAPSIRKWVEFGRPKSACVSWQPQTADETMHTKRPAFVGPLSVYETPTPRLPVDDLCQNLADIRLSKNKSEQAKPHDDATSREDTGILESTIYDGNLSEHIRNGETLPEKRQ